MLGKFELRMGTRTEKDAELLLQAILEACDIRPIKEDPYQIPDDLAAGLLPSRINTYKKPKHSGAFRPINSLSSAAGKAPGSATKRLSGNILSTMAYRKTAPLKPYQQLSLNVPNTLLPHKSPPDFSAKTPTPVQRTPRDRDLPPPLSAGSSGTSGSNIKPHDQLNYSGQMQQARNSQDQIRDLLLNPPPAASKLCSKENNPLSSLIYRRILASACSRAARSIAAIILP